MISKRMQELAKNSSAIRAMFEEGNKMAEQYGVQNVYDFSLGNPNTPPPAAINQMIMAILRDEKPTFVHGYMNNAGYEDVRQAIAGASNKRYGSCLQAQHIIMTVGAAGGLNVILKTLLDPGDEIAVFAPFFGEYRAYAGHAEGVLTVVPPNPPAFQPNLEAFEKMLSKQTKAVIVNSPNNPSGVVYTQETLSRLADILKNAQAAFGHPIYLISDEPYRELVYDGVTVPYIPDYYDNTIVCYSYSKSLSMPGERIGYLAISGEVDGFDEIINGATVANRTLGFVNAPSLLQRLAARCVDLEVDITPYDQNRQALYDGLVSAGYECVKPQGAFYLFVKSPIADDQAFCVMAKKYRLLIVPGSAFACPGYIRIAYCVSHETILAALPQFQALMGEVKAG